MIHKPRRALSSFTGAVASVLFAAACAYIIAHFAAGSAPGFAVARLCTLSRGAALDGIVIRDERALSAAAPPSVLYADGARACAGSAVAETAEGEEISTDASALFFSGTDGLEYLTPEDVQPLTPEKLAALMRAQPREDEGRFGRLVRGFAWYYTASAATAADAQTLSPGRYKLRFDGFDEALDARLLTNNDNALLFRVMSGKSGYMSLRRCAARLITEERTGLLLPASAVETDGAGNEYVYRCTAGGYERTAVQIIYKDGDACLAGTGGALENGGRVLADWRDKDDGGYS